MKNKKRIFELEQNIKKNIFHGREAKPAKKWREAIGYFKEAEILLQQLDKEAPLIDVRVERFKRIVYFLIAAITGYLIAMV